MKSVRNYIAHRSRQSLSTYQKVLTDAGVSTTTAPGQFLCQQSPTRLDIYLSELLAIGSVVAP